MSTCAAVLRNHPLHALNMLPVAEVRRLAPNRTGERLCGRVKFFKNGYGFIKVRDAATGAMEDFHFHSSSMRRRGPIGQGLIVEFTPVPVPDPDKCRKAIDVVVLA